MLLHVLLLPVMLLLLLLLLLLIALHNAAEVWLQLWTEP